MLVGTLAVDHMLDCNGGVGAECHKLFELLSARSNGLAGRADLAFTIGAPITAIIGNEFVVDDRLTQTGDVVDAMTYVAANATGFTRTVLVITECGYAFSNGDQNVIKVLKDGLHEDSMGRE